jgi:hypothetical protein
MEPRRGPSRRAHKKTVMPIAGKKDAKQRTQEVFFEIYPAISFLFFIFRRKYPIIIADT